MRLIRLVVAPIALAMLPQGAQAKADRSAVHCIYGQVADLERPVLVKLVKAGYQARTSNEKVMLTRVGDGITACRGEHGWGEPRKALAIRYLTARVLRDDALAQGKKLGLTAETLDAIVAKLPEARRAAVSQGQFDTDAAAVIAQALADPALGFDKLPDADHTVLDDLVRQGVTARMLEHELEASYANG